MPGLTDGGERICQWLRRIPEQRGDAGSDPAATAGKLIAFLIQRGGDLAQRAALPAQAVGSLGGAATAAKAAVCEKIQHGRSVPFTTASRHQSFFAQPSPNRSQAQPLGSQRDGPLGCSVRVADDSWARRLVESAALVMPLAL